MIGSMRRQELLQFRIACGAPNSSIRAEPISAIDALMEEGNTIGHVREQSFISWVTQIIVMPSAASMRQRVEHFADRAADRAPRSPRRTACRPATWQARGQSPCAAAGRRTCGWDRPQASRRGQHASTACTAIRLGFVLDRPRTCAGASMTFSSTVRCGKAFHCWKTMPTLATKLVEVGRSWHEHRCRR